MSFKKSQRNTLSRISVMLFSMTIIGLMTVAGCITTSVSARQINETTRTQPWSPYHNQTIIMENLTAKYAPQLGTAKLDPIELGYNEVDGIVYFKTKGNQTCLWQMDEDTTEFSFVHYFGGPIIMNLLRSNDGSLIVALNNGTILRSIDNGISWTTTLTMTSGTYAWRLATRGNAVYAGEYGNGPPTGATLWRSSDNGKPGTWSSVWTTPTEYLGPNNHIHIVATDPYTNYVYVVSGDYADAMARSTDGIHFSNWGVSQQFTSVAFAHDNIYWGDDNIHSVYVYNRTTEEFSLASVPEYGQFPTTLGAVYYMATGKNGVTYAASTVEGVDYRAGGLHITVNGRDWYTIANRSRLSNDAGGTLAVHGGYVYYYYVNDASYAVTVRFRELTFDQAKALIYSDKDIGKKGTNVIYDMASAAYDGENKYLAFPDGVFTNAKVTFEGRMSRNYIVNSSFETNENWSNAEGWMKYVYSGHENNGNVERSSEMAWDGTYSAKLTGWGLAGSHFRIQNAEWRDNANPIPAGTPIYWSWYRYMTKGNVEHYSNGTIAVNLHLEYSDATTTDTAPPWPGYGALLSNNTWQRVEYRYVPAKAVRAMYVAYYAKGNCTGYIDAIQLQIGFLSPYVTTGFHNTTNPSITIDGKKFGYTGEVENGHFVTVNIGIPLSGFHNIEFQINGSRYSNWSISATRLASSYDSWVSIEDGIVVMTHDYGKQAIEFWNAGCVVDPSSFLTGTRGTTYFKSDPTGGTDNVTFLSWSDTLKWSADTNATSVTYTISGLSPTADYHVYQNDVEIYQQQSGYSSLSFTVTGGGVFIVVKFYGSGVQLQPDFDYSVSKFLVTFKDSTIGSVVSWYWDFGDGFTSTLQNPTHVYTKPGKYTVKLAVVDKYGLTRTVEKVITIEGGAAQYTLVLPTILIVALLIAVLLTRNVYVTFIVAIAVILIIVLWGMGLLPELNIQLGKWPG